MRALEILHARFARQLAFLHANRRAAMWRAVLALLIGKQLWLTALGRALPTSAMRKHAIKAIDRLLGNRHLHRDRLAIAAALASFVVEERSAPIVLVDTVEIRHRVVALTAAVAHDGRSLPIWSTVVTHVRPRASECARFLRELAQVLPRSCRPIVVTDAGFETAWLNEVERHGWDYVARVRGRTHVLYGGRWTSLPQIRQLATKRAKNLGVVELPKQAPVARRAVLSKIPVCRHRQVATRSGPARGTNYRVYRANAYEPIVAVTSLRCRPSQVIAIYALRMQIEESFRDLKNHRWGWSLRHCGSRTRARLEILLLVAAIASLVQQLVGVAAEARGLQRTHQANTTTTRRVISLFVLGGLVLDNRQFIPPAAIAAALTRVRKKIAALRESAR